MKPTSAIMGAGLGKDVAMLTDGRFSGGSHVSYYIYTLKGRENNNNMLSPIKESKRGKLTDDDDVWYYSTLFRVSSLVTSPLKLKLVVPLLL